MGPSFLLTEVTAVVDTAGLPDLPVGLPVEPSPLLLLLRGAAFAWGLVLLVGGDRRGLATAGTQAVGVGLLVDFALSESLTTPAALAVVAACLATGLAGAVWTPRLSSAWLAFWPLPAVLVGTVLDAGYLRPDLVPLLILAAAGVALGAAAPSAGHALAAAGLGAGLVTLALGLGFRTAFALAVVSLGLAVVTRRRAAGRVDWRLGVGLRRSNCSRWRRASGRGVVALVAAGVGVAALAPRVDPGGSPTPGRVDRLREQGRLRRPELVLGAENSLYLVGRPDPIALVSPIPGWRGRLGLLLSGGCPVSAIHRLRAVKDDAELALMRRAAAITAQAFVDVRPLIRPGVNESEVAGHILRSFASRGATGVAFPPVVASGVRATRPHYQRNDATMTDGLVVIDIGCSVDGYASDMTRTFPVRGEPSAAEAELLGAVVAALDAARALLRPGATMGELDQAARAVIREAGFGPYFTHSVGHHVGLAVHDPHQAHLTAGMVVTLEPGIYIPPGAPVDPVYWSLGVRVEDTFVVTPGGSSPLTDCPRLP